MVNDLHVLLFLRLKPGFQRIMANGSGRSAFVVQADNGRATFDINQPSDCLALQKTDVVCTEIHTIDVWFGGKFTSLINGREYPESPEVWQRAINHVLNVYKPEYCYISTGGADTGLGDKLRVNLEAQGNYKCFWDSKQHILSILRLVDCEGKLAYTEPSEIVLQCIYLRFSVQSG